jgi:hypothetical protein
MGDNVRLTDHDKLIAADEIDNIKHLKVKLTYGEDDSVSSVSPNNPLPVSSSPSSSSGDAFGKLRVSQPITLGDYHHISGENTEMILKTSGGGSGSADVATSSYILSLGTTDGGYAIHQSKMYHHYLPGKSQVFLHSFCFGTARENTIKRCGYFDDRNGIFLQEEGDGSLSFVMRSYITGTAIDTVIPQEDWNIDTCSTTLQGEGVLPDGSNAQNFGKVGSFDLDVSKTQLLMLDFQWLGVGRLRIGFVHDGKWVIAHEIYHSNYNTNVYWTQPSLPVRCEIRNIGTAVGTATLKQICGTVMSEGGYTETGLINLQHSSLTGRTIQNGGDSMCILAVRLKNTYNGDLVRGIVRILQASLIVTNGPVFFELVKFNSHTSITGGDWVNHGDDSIIEYNATATGFSNAISLAGQFLQAAASVNTTSSGSVSNPTVNKRGFITQNYDSTESEAYAIIATALDSSNNVNIKAYAALQWSETR